MLFNLNKLLMLWVTEYIFTDPVLKEIVEKTGLSINSIKNKTPKYLKLVLCNQWGSFVPSTYKYDLFFASKIIIIWNQIVKWLIVLTMN